MYVTRLRQFHSSYQPVFFDAGQVEILESS